MNRPGMQTSDLPDIEIRPDTAFRMLDTRELWSYRELMYFLTWRDVKVRYKQTAIGILWAVLQPVAMMLVFTLIFGRLAKMPSSGVPFSLFSLSGLLPWQLFSRAITESTNSLVTDQRLISRVYFPRIIVPIASVMAALVDFLIAATILFLLLVGYGLPLRVELIWMPVFMLLLILAALGVGFWLSALNVEYRDVTYTLPFLNQFWFFITPVVYPASLLPDRWRFVYALNPIAGVVEGFRWALFGIGTAPGSMLAASAVVSILLFCTGSMWFRLRERSFADAIGSGGR